MKKIILLFTFLSLIVSSNVKANPIVLPPVISEFYIVNDSTWYLELVITHNYYSNTISLKGFHIESLSGSSVFKHEISVTLDSIIIITQDSMQSPLHFNRNGDYIYIKDSTGFINDKIYFGNISGAQISAPSTGQSIVNLANSCWDSNEGASAVQYYLVKDNNPTIGYNAFKPSSAIGTFKGIVYDNGHHPVEGIKVGDSYRIDNGPSYLCANFFGYDLTDSSGSFISNEYSVRRYIQIYYKPSRVFINSLIMIEPDSINYYEFTIDTLLTGIHAFSLKNNYSLQIFPNPGSENFTFQITAPELNYSNGLLKIYNIEGELVNIIPVNKTHDSFASVSWNGKGRYNELPSGIYTCSFEINGNTVASQKLIIKK